MNAKTKFHVSVMDARLKKMREERDSFEKQRNELLNDMKETKFKAELFDELLNSFSDNLLIYGALAKSLVDRYEINKDLESEE